MTGPDVLVCNLGEQAEILSAGTFVSTPHRVLANRSSQPRISVPLFYNPGLNASITPLELPLSHLEEDLPRKNKQSSWSQRDDNRILSTVGENTFKSLARSHPEVFRRHHPDLAVVEGCIVREKKRK